MNGYLHKDVCTFIIISHSALLRTTDVSDKVVDKTTQTQIMSNYFSTKIVQFV